MFGSQALEVLIGLALTMLIVSLGASTVVELVSARFQARAKLLESAVAYFLEGGGLEGAAADEHEGHDHAGPPGRTMLAETTVVRGLAGPKRRFPSYMSSAAFVDAVAELTDSTGAVPPGVEQRLRPGLERDESPEDLRKRIAVSANVSVYHIARSLWSDTTTRQAIVQAANHVDPNGIDASDLESVGDTVDHLQEVGVPVGWTDQAKADWGSPGDLSWTRFGMILGWLMTGVLVTLGAPFWFDVLTKLTSVRAAGQKPTRVTDDKPKPDVVAHGNDERIVDTSAHDPIRRALGARQPQATE